MNVAEVRDRLARLRPTPRVRLREWDDLVAFEDLADASVLIPLRITERGHEVILTERSLHLSKHSGEISFPGGRRDPEDLDLRATALRETHEEIALSPSDVHVFGALMQMPTVTGYSVTTFVGEFDVTYPLRPNPAEIQTLLPVPLEELADPGIHRLEERTWNDMTFQVHYFDWRGWTIWGATGLMLHTLLEYLELR